MDLNENIIIKNLCKFVQQNRPHLFVLFHKVQRTQFFILRSTLLYKAFILPPFKYCHCLYEWLALPWI